MFVGYAWRFRPGSTGIRQRRVKATSGRSACDPLLRTQRLPGVQFLRCFLPHILLRGVILDQAIDLGDVVLWAGFNTGPGRCCRHLFSSVGGLEILKKVTTDSHLLSRPVARFRHPSACRMSLRNKKIGLENSLFRREGRQARPYAARFHDRKSPLFTIL